MSHREMTVTKEEFDQIKQDLNETLSMDIALHRWIQRKMPVDEEDISMMRYFVEKTEAEREFENRKNREGNE